MKENRKKKAVGSRQEAVMIAAGLAFVCLLGAIYFWKSANVRYPWVENYAKDQIFPPKDVAVKGPRHILFLVTDHFEPENQAAMDRWMKNYPEMAIKHRDADGRPPQHTWFWFFEKSDDAEKLRFLQQLSELSYRGFGEVELHLHHANDTDATFKEKMRHAIELSQETGAMITAEARPRTSFSFIHGFWGLDNSRSAGFCGINDELIQLRRLGCYADFTHPSWGVMHPKIVNRLYYAADDLSAPKSYDTGSLMEMGKPPAGDLLIFEGPSVVTFRGLRPQYDDGDMTHVDLPVPARVDRWVKSNIHVHGRPEWIFVKVFTHGALEEDHEAVLGKAQDEMYSYLEKRYNDGKKFVLHYATAREAYNIAKAAEAGKSGNPNEYRDFVIPPYVNRFFIASAPFETIEASQNQIIVRFLAPAGTAVKARIRNAAGKENSLDFTVKNPAVAAFEIPAVPR